MFSEYLPLIYSATLMTLGLALASLVVGLLLSMLFVVLETSKQPCMSKPTSVF
ncbi:arginine transporter permease subunit ArtQ [Actinobacillus equuli]|nr:arginine transporter permease subunit ArtQ [Actinobacillus equuli]